MPRIILKLLTWGGGEELKIVIKLQKWNTTLILSISEIIIPKRHRKAREKKTLSTEQALSSAWKRFHLDYQTRQSYDEASQDVHRLQTPHPRDSEGIYFEGKIS